ncbi:hypothetical protein [Streptomyces sp. NPDC054797]
MTPQAVSPPLAGTPPLSLAWQTLADGLMTQRLYLHLDEWRSGVAAGGRLADIEDIGPAHLAGRPGLQPSTEARELLSSSGLGYWYDLPRQHGAECAGPGSPLQAEAHRTAWRISAEGSAAPWREAVAVACEAAAWWVGFFSVIRHRGVHHLTLEPHPSPLHAQALVLAVRAVAVGMATRVLEAALRTAEPSDLRSAYCRAIEFGIEAELELPELLDELGELRLVDLVSTSARWRGRFTKYTGGTGAGQVE